VYRGDTHAPCIRHYEQHFFGAVYCLSPSRLGRVQLARLGPCFHVCRAVLQEYCDCRDRILCPSQRLQHRDPPFPHAHVRRVFPENLFVPVKHLLEICVRLRGGFIVDAPECDDALVLVAEARFQSLEDGARGGLVAGAQGRVEEVFVDGP